MDEWRDDRIGAALRGENPSVIARVPGGFATMGDPQFLPGYCVLLTDDPSVTRLSDLGRDARRGYLDSVAALAEAVEVACAASDPAFRRVNIEILGNHSPYLHTHVWPRYDWEPPAVVQRPVWLHPIEHWHDPATALGPQHDPLRRSITQRVRALTAVTVPGAGTAPERP